MHQADVITVVMVVVTGDVAALPIPDRARLAAKHIPDGWSFPILGSRPFDLIRGSCRAPAKTFRKTHRFAFRLRWRQRSTPAPPAARVPQSSPLSMHGGNAARAAPPTEPSLLQAAGSLVPRLRAAQGFGVVAYQTSPSRSGSVPLLVKGSLYMTRRCCSPRGTVFVPILWYRVVSLVRLRNS